MGAFCQWANIIIKFLQTPIDETIAQCQEYIVRRRSKRKLKKGSEVFKKPTSFSTRTELIPISERNFWVRQRFFWSRQKERCLSSCHFSLASCLRNYRWQHCSRQAIKKLPKKLKPKKINYKRPITPEKQFQKENLKLSIRASTSIAVTMAIVVSSYFIYELIFVGLPDIKLLASAHQSATTKIYDRNHHLLFSIYEDENRSPVPLSAISPYLLQATIAIEDKGFYDHHGFDIQGIIRAYLVNQESDSLKQGGSTITQQLIKKRLLTSEKTFLRKARELILSILAEGNYSKEQILEMYLNEINYGGAIYGIEQASISYFGKNARNLTLAESAFLAAIPAYPSYYAPFANHLDETMERQKEVLRRMTEDGYITVAQAAEAGAQELEFVPNVINIKAPHFVMYVRELLAEEYGEEMVSTGGLEVVTTLDLAMQTKVEEIVKNEVDSLEPMRIRNGAAMMTNPQTGEILAMVGSKDYFDSKNDGMVNVCLRPRQPGSSIKPLTYALALENGFTPASIIDDQPVTYQAPGGKPYSPKNYDGTYHGRVTLRESLGSSYNIPAVKVLNEVGVTNLIDQGERMGITTWEDRSRFGLSLTLGGGDVKMIDLVKVYGAFANGGYTLDQNPILLVRDSKGKTLYQNSCVTSGTGCGRIKTLSEETAYQITSVLSDNNARIPAFGPQSVLYIPDQEVAVKTGTTNNLRDNWTVGYTTDRLVAVWVGNNDNTPMSYVASGITGASPIWRNIIEITLEPDTAHTFQVPSSLNAVEICAKSGTLYCPGCQAITEYFKSGTEPTAGCRVDPQNINPADFEYLFDL